MGNFI